MSKRKDLRYRAGRSGDWLKSKTPACEAVCREAEEDWGATIEGNVRPHADLIMLFLCL